MEGGYLLPKFLFYVIHSENECDEGKRALTNNDFAIDWFCLREEILKNLPVISAPKVALHIHINSITLIKGPVQVLRSFLRGFGESRPKCPERVGRALVLWYRGEIWGKALFQREREYDGYDRNTESFRRSHDPGKNNGKSWIVLMNKFIYGNIYYYRSWLGSNESTHLLLHLVVCIICLFALQRRDNAYDAIYERSARLCFPLGEIGGWKNDACIEDFLGLDGAGTRGKRKLIWSTCVGRSECGEGESREVALPACTDTWWGQRWWDHGWERERDFVRGRKSRIEVGNMMEEGKDG